MGSKDFIAKYWYANIYEQFENHQHDALFLLDILRERFGAARLDLLEVACGGGRLLSHFARAGFNVTGFDSDQQMLLRCVAKLQGEKNVRLFEADAIFDDWGGEYDVIVIAGNFLINIESRLDYATAQQKLLRNARGHLKPGGCVLLDFDLHFDPAAVFNRQGESRGWEGTDDIGNFGRIVGFGSVYNPVTQICTGSNHWEITTGTGERFVAPRPWCKHIPSQKQIWDWCESAGFVIEKSFKNYTQQPVPVPPDEGTSRAALVLSLES